MNKYLYLPGILSYFVLWGLALHTTIFHNDPGGLIFMAFSTIVITLIVWMAQSDV